MIKLLIVSLCIFFLSPIGEQRIDISDRISKEPLVESEYICSKGTFKSYMDFRKITSPSSRQFKLQKIAETNKDGHRVVGKYIMVAMSKEYGPVGAKYEVYFKDGQSISVIIGDVKHEKCVSSADGSIIEFIVDTKLMSPLIRRLGNYNKIYNGPIVAIIKVSST
jgi:hypothetical protein